MGSSNIIRPRCLFFYYIKCAEGYPLLYQGADKMCSISGIIDFKNKENINDQVLNNMGEALRHRGPDQNGFYKKDSIALWHNRLAIMDIENGIQPMCASYQGKKYVIVYNGEVYNTKELKHEIETYGVKFQTHCDTEIVLYSYIIFGEKCSEKLNGIFAFVIYDESKNAIYLSRDRFGIKPLFYTQLGSTFIFSSEVKAILKHPKVKAEVNRVGLWQLLYLSPVKLNGTSVFKDIEEIPAAYHGYYTIQGLEIRKYWKLKAYENEGNEDEIIEHTRMLLEDAISSQLISDAPLCTFLSGGLDSSIISAIAAKHYRNQGLQLSTYSFEHEGNKEHFKNTNFQPQRDDEYATYIANYLGTNHKILTASVDDTICLLYDAVKYRDLPGMADVDSSLLYYCKQVKNNHTVAISGECSDEIFGGYPWFYKKEMQDTGFFPWIHDPFVRINLFKDDITHKQEGFKYITEKYNESLKTCPIIHGELESMRNSRYATWLSVNYFMTSLLERKDRMSMATGVEVRVPFADHRIIEYVYNIPWEIKFKGNVEKYLLREAMKEYLPDIIVNRKKSPYPKTHNPSYEGRVTKILQERLNNKNSVLFQIIDKDRMEKLIQGDNTTWFGQLMSKPQLIGWLIQLDYWFEIYNINLVD